MDYHQLDAFTSAYVDALLFSEMDNSDASGGSPLDDNYAWDCISPETQAEIIRECADFQASFGHLIAGREAKAGQDFAFTRNGHGTGFWDGDWREPLDPPNLWHSDLGSYLTAMSKPYGTFNFYVHNGRIYHHG